MSTSQTQKPAPFCKKLGLGVELHGTFSFGIKAYYVEICSNYHEVAQAVKDGYGNDTVVN